ncbi:hypothetical protein JW948_12405 [bacterium]|nr:hypothetical protein [bacterium]
MKTFKSPITAYAVFLITFPILVHTQNPVPGPGPDPDPLRFQSEIDAFVQWDRKNSVPGHAVLFIGSSSIRMWMTREAFPEWPVVNRGFGGAHISDVDYYYQQVIAPYEPDIVVFYCGDNDIAGHKTVEQVFEDYQNLEARIREDFPEVRFIYLPIKPSLSRWDYWEAMKEVNVLIEEDCEKNAYCFYLDTATPMLNSEGRPDKTLLRDDGLHLTEKGYAVWNKLLQDLLSSFPAD